MPSHRSGSLKQSNKKHKVPGGTRPSNEHALQGRVQRKSAKTTNSATLGYEVENNYFPVLIVHSFRKQDRLNRHKQLMQEKRLNTIRTKRQSMSAVYLF
jgi:hypothetical protein